MPITSIGYQGQMTTTQYSKVAQSLGRSYTVFGADSLRPGPSALDRSVVIEAGQVAGRGVLDTLDVPTVVTMPTISSGSRYDMVVMRRDWSTNTSSLAVVQGTSDRALPTRFVGAGVKDDQPLALCRMVAGQTAVQEIIDLRVWNADGGCFAKNEFFGGYMLEVGTQVRVGNELWTRTIDSSSGSPIWDRKKLTSSAVEYLGTATTGVIDGAWSADAAKGLLFQGGTLVQWTDSAGYARLTFPTPFPNGLLTGWLHNGDHGSNPGVSYEVAGQGIWGWGDETKIVYRALDAAGGLKANYLHRVNWGYFGW